MKYYTENRINVTKRIKKGLTEFFSNKLIEFEEKAKKFAEERKTYIYPIFNKNNDFIGYGIPK